MLPMNCLSMGNYYEIMGYSYYCCQGCKTIPILGMRKYPMGSGQEVSHVDVLPSFFHQNYIFFGFGSFSCAMSY